GVYVYGQAADATGEEPLTSLDVIAHELMHGVTHFSVSRRTGDPLGLDTDLPSSTRLGPRSITTDGGETLPCDPDLLWCVDGRFVLSSPQGGAVNEAYSDIVGESVGFFHEDSGATADYLQGSEQSFGPIRSLAEPGSLSIVDGSHRPYPDAYQDRYEFAIFRNTLISTPNPLHAGLDLGDEPDNWEYAGVVFVNGQFAFLLPGGSGYGGEHWNSTILSHAFYLAIEGGTNRTTGLRVDGVGDAGRGEIERIFFRAMTDLMPAATSLPLAANAIRQAAADLAPGSEAQRAVRQALVAVGLPPA
ncbi:MAG: M4 family metallopeptidase, partial [Acidobacteria bacterium]|nr:M4 family metallopeptidase [Acidobacteriota bacterium]